MKGLTAMGSILTKAMQLKPSCRTGEIPRFAWNGKGCIVGNACHSERSEESFGLLFSTEAYIIPTGKADVAFPPSPPDLIKAHSVASAWGEAAANSCAFSTSPLCPLSIYGEGEPPVQGAALPSSPFTERGDWGVRLDKTENGVGFLNPDVVPLSATLLSPAVAVEGGQGESKDMWARLCEGFPALESPIGECLPAKRIVYQSRMPLVRRHSCRRTKSVRARRQECRCTGGAFVRDGRNAVAPSRRFLSGGTYYFIELKHWLAHVC